MRTSIVFVLNIISIKYSMYDVNCDANYYVYGKEYLSRRRRLRYSLVYSVYLLSS